jgi:hypothetical protein
MLVQELLEVVNYGLRLAEETTGLPSLLQGQQGSAPMTVGGMTMLNNNATSVLRRLARIFDDKVTEPHIRRYYAWLLQYGENDDIKGDFQIDARGSSALVERDLQNQQIVAMGQFVADPTYGLDKKKWAREMLMSNHLDPKKFEFDDEEWQKMLQQLAQPPPDPTIEAANVRAQSQIRVAELRKEAEEAVQASVENIAERKLEVDIEKFESSQEFELMMRELDQDVTAYQEMNKKGLNDETLKTKMAETAIKVKAMYDLAVVNAKAKAISPPAEPPGRAPRGQSYSR